MLSCAREWFVRSMNTLFDATKVESPSSKLLPIVGSLLLMVCSLSSAADIASSADYAGNSNEVLPRLESAARLALPDGRNVTVHREAQSGGQRSKAIYFHRPIFSFDIKQKVHEPISSLDAPIVWDKEQRDGYEYLLLRVTLSSPEFRELARTAVIEQDPSIRVELPSISERDIDVRPWPLKLLRLEARHALTGEEFGTSIPKPLGASGDKIDVSLKVPTEKLSAFVQALRSGRLEFFPSYTFENSVIAFGQAATRISGEVSVGIKNSLRSQNLEEGRPILQSERRELETELRQTVLTAIRATDSSVLAHLGSDDISDQLFTSKQVPFSELDDGSTLLKRVEAYLAPIIRQMSQENEDIQQATQTSESKATKDVSFGASGAGPNISGKLTDEQIDILTNDHRIRFKSTENSQVLEASTIEVSFLRSGWQNNIFESFRTVYLAVGRDSSFFPDSPIGASFTTEKLVEILGQGRMEVAPHALVPRGVILCSLRSDVPKGFVSLTGKDLPTLPNESWVHERLRGKAAPNLAGVYLRGAEDPSQIGQVSADGKYIIPEVTINSAENRVFKLQRDGAGKVIATERERFKLDGEVCGNTDNARCRSVVITFPLVNKSMFTGMVEGSVTMPGHEIDFSSEKNQPPHTECQWIMRIE